MDNDKGEPKARGALDARTLREAKEFTIVFADNKGINVSKLIGIDAYHLVVKNQDSKLLLVPKHSIKYFLL